MKLKPFMKLDFFAENSMDQDGGYSKQQIGSLTTDGEGEFRTLHVSGIFKTDLQPTCSRLDVAD